MANGPNLSANREATTRDTVTFSRTAFSWALGLSASFILSLSGVLYSIHNSNILATERIAAHQKFIDNSAFYPISRGIRAETRIVDLDVARHAHNARAEQLIGKWSQKFEEIDREFARVDRTCEYLLGESRDEKRRGVK